MYTSFYFDKNTWFPTLKTFLLKVAIPNEINVFHLVENILYDKPVCDLDTLVLSFV